MDKYTLLFQHLLEKHNLACTNTELEQILKIARRTIAQTDKGGVSRFMVLKEMADRDLNIKSSDMYGGVAIDDLGELVKMGINRKIYDEMRANPNLVPTLIIVDYPTYIAIEKELKIK